MHTHQPKPAGMASFLFSVFILLFLLGLASCGGKSTTRQDAGPDASDVSGSDADAGDIACAPGTPAGNSPTTAYRSIELRPEGFVVDGQWKTLRGGTVQWFRIPKGDWRDRLRKFAGAFNTVDVYVPWNVVEPQPGQFDFGDLLEFLALCKEFGLYVYFRPGPYICNEMNGGGVPAWLVPLAGKKSTADDGIVNFRTRDPDYLEYVRNYFSSLNRAIAPFQVSRGGPILLYAVENEYNWFEIFAGVDKLAWYEGGTERSVGQDIGTTEYLAALRDFVRADGIDVPITTCPGDSRISGMGDAYGIVPMPNFYISGGTEKLAYDVITGMHDPARYDGRYVALPSGTTESERRATRMVRTFFGGMDAYFAFNAAGMATPDRHNALVLDNSGLFSMVDPTPDRVLQAFVSPTVGYFHNVIDYYGPIGPGGTLREKYYQFRARHLFLESFDSFFAPLLHPLRSGDFPGADPRMRVDHADVGALEDGRRVHYWFSTSEGAWFAQLLNETAAPLELPPGSVTIDGISFPRYTTLTLPLSPFPGSAGGESGLNAANSPEELHYAHIAVGRFPLLPDLELTHTTAEILTWREFNGEKLLVLTVPLGAEGEVVFSGRESAPAAIQIPQGVERPAAGERELALVWTSEKTPRMAHLVSPQGTPVRLWLLPTQDAGRYWFFRAAFQDAAIGPLADFELLDDDACRLHARAWLEPEADRVYVFSASAMQLDGGTQACPFDPETGFCAVIPPEAGEKPALPRMEIRVQPEPVMPPDAWASLGDSAIPLESAGILSGNVWLRARATLPNPPPSDGQLYVEHASDIVGVSVNGTYVTTLSPVGTEIDNKSTNGHYRFTDLRPLLHAGDNEVLFRVEIWGHGSFMWPRGRIIATSAQIPSLGFDSFKGLWGRARLAGRDLVDWKFATGSSGERLGWHAGGGEDGFSPAQLPLALARGQSLWVRARIPEIPASAWDAPVALRLQGRNLLGTIWLDGRIVGRWLSDEAFLQRGAWTRARRDMWMNTSPDEFPLAPSMLEPGTEHFLVVRLDDASGHEDASGGMLDTFELVRFSEEKSRDAEGNPQIAPRWLRSFPLSFSPAVPH